MTSIFREARVHFRHDPCACAKAPVPTPGPPGSSDRKEFCRPRRSAVDMSRSRVLQTTRRDRRAARASRWRFPVSQGGDHRSPVRIYRESLLLHRSEGDLLRFSVRKPLSPKMAFLFNQSGEKHPGIIGRPADRRAVARRTGNPDRESAIQRDKAASRPCSCFVHFND